MQEKSNKHNLVVCQLLCKHYLHIIKGKNFQNKMQTSVNLQFLTRKINIGLHQSIIISQP